MADYIIKNIRGENNDWERERNNEFSIESSERKG